jgi:hypothetical protein
MSVRHHIAHIEAYRRQPRAVEKFDPFLLAAGIEAPALSAKQHFANTSLAACYVATQVSKRTPRSQAQKDHSRQTRTVEAKAARQEVQGILMRFRWLGAVRG